MKRSIVLGIFIVILIVLEVFFAYMGHKRGYSNGYAQGVKDGLQQYANHMSDVLSGDYKFCALNKDPLIVMPDPNDKAHLTFMCKRDNNTYYGYKPSY